jgi:asparagine synthase (glutamine-hydrolysing)
VRGGVLEPADRYLSWVTYFSEEAKRELYAPGAAGRLSEFDGTAFLRALLEDPADPDFNERVFYADVKTYLPYNQLHYSDRMSMAHGLELRVPFCDHELLELSAEIPFGMKTRGLRTKALLRDALSGLLPRWVLRGKKLGLNPPVGIWLKGPLRPLVQEVFSPERVAARGYFRPEAIGQLLAEHAGGTRDRSMEIWMLLVFEVWHRVYLEGRVPEEALPEAAGVA